MQGQLPVEGEQRVGLQPRAAADRRFVELSAVTAGVKDVRTVMDQAVQERSLHGRQTVLFLDEIHRFTKAQQDALLPGVENQWVVLVAATTENPSFSVISPLLSRSLLLTLQPLERSDIGALLDRAVLDPRGLNGEVELSAEAREHLLELCGGDARKALTSLEAAAGVAFSEQPAPADQDGDGDSGGPVPLITREHAEEALDRAAVRYDKNGDQHYDVVSAFIKSIRGSDVDAAMHYLARMIEAGEDPRFIARRLIISASEDIGTADPTALQTAVAAADAVQLIGMPEGRIPLAQAVAHLATAPKSNAAYTAINEAIADVRAGRAGPVPLHLRDAHYPGAGQLGHGVVGASSRLIDAPHMGHVAELLDPALDLPAAGKRRLLGGRNGIDVRRIGRERLTDALLACVIAKLAKHPAHTGRSAGLLYHGFPLAT